MRLNLFITLLFALSFSACAQQRWVHNNPSANFAGDSFACENEAATRHPYPKAAPVQESPSYNTNCSRMGSSLNCQSTPTTSAGSTQINNQLYEMGAKPGVDISRGVYKSSCLEARGWRSELFESPKADNAELAVRKAELEKKVNAVCSFPELKMYFSKSPCFPKDINFSHLVDESKITAQEKVVFLEAKKIMASVDQEREQYFLMIGSAGQKLLNIRKSFYDPENEKNSISLYSGQITWGEYNKRRREIYEAVLKM